MKEKITNWLNKDSYYLGIDENGPMYSITGRETIAVLIVAMFVCSIVLSAGIIIWRALV